MLTSKIIKNLDFLLLFLKIIDDLIHNTYLTIYGLNKLTLGLPFLQKHIIHKFNSHDNRYLIKEDSLHSN